jgi:hypothetical protein
MNLPSLKKRSPRRVLLASLLGISTAAWLSAQIAPAADPAMLAKYDTNKNGTLEADELSKMRADEAQVAVSANNAAPKLDDDTVRLTPFEVQEANNGYYASNTMSGTRLNTKIGDLASSVSVVTKQQMSDLAMLDINDVFAYEASTEGTSNFTDFTVDRNGMVSDTIQNNPQGANRIRGVGAANQALGNYATSGRVPVDPIGIDGIEISRGPNSNIFGLGQGSGTVNLIPSTALLTREISTAEFRVDSLGGYRTSLDLNRPIIQGKLAFRAQGVYQHEAYNEKPSGTTTRRYNFMLRAQPFKNTTLRATFSQYDFGGARANSVTPRDTVSYWKSLGSPTWDPVANAVTVNGVTTVMTTTTNPTGLTGSTFANPSIWVDQRGIGLWEISRLPATTATNGPNNTAGINRLLETQAPPVRTNRPLYSTVPGISDKAIFDYTEINLAGANYIRDHNEMTTVEFEQYFLNTESHQIAMQLGWNHEYASRLNKNIVGSSSDTGNSNYLYVDVNSKLLDGRDNPYFLRPYLGVGDPIHSQSPYFRDTYRGQLAYVANFTNKSGWLKWLGRHSINGYSEEKLTKQFTYKWRDINITDNAIYSPVGGPPKANKANPVGPVAVRGYYRFYVGDNKGQNIDYAPTLYKYGNYTFNWFNPVTNQWVADQATLGEGAIQEGVAGNFASRNELKTRGIVLQSQVIEDRVVFTGGKRHDENFTKFQKPSAILPDGINYNYPAMNGWAGDWSVGKGDTTSTGWVVRPFRFGFVDRMASKDGVEGMFGKLLRGLGVYYNKSDSFTPDAPALTVTREFLTNPTSNGKDYGFTLSFLDDKFVLRANRYTTVQINNRNGQFGTFGQRVLRVDLQNFAGNADAISLQRQARNWVLAANPAFSTAQVDDAVYKIMGLTPEQVNLYNTSTIGETQDITAKGDELELNYNPNAYWSLKGNVTRTKSIDANIAPHIPAWIAQRMPYWSTIIDPRVGTPWFTTGYVGDAPDATGGTPQTFLNNNIVSPIALAQATQGKNRSQIREWHYSLTGRVSLAQFTDHRIWKNISLGGSARYESEGTIGYYGIPINGDITIATQFDGNRPINSSANYYFDAFATYTTRLFHDKVRAKFQLNARNLQEWKARLEAVGAYPDGTPHTFRIIEPVSFIFSTTFEL